MAGEVAAEVGGGPASERHHVAGPRGVVGGEQINRGAEGRGGVDHGGECGESGVGGVAREDHVGGFGEEVGEPAKEHRQSVRGAGLDAASRPATSASRCARVCAARASAASSRLERSSS